MRVIAWLSPAPRAAPGDWIVKSVKIEIREAKIEDLGQITDLWEELVSHHAELSHHFELAEDGREKWSKYLAKKYSEKSTKVVVASIDGEVVGFMLCLLSPNVPVFREKTVGTVSDVYVRPNLRGKGITREMLKMCLKWFNKNKVKSVQLNVAAANFEARAAWGQLGFKPHMIQKRLDIDKYPATEMIEEEPKAIRRKVMKRVPKKK